MGGSMFSGSSQRRQAMATATAQQQELDAQKAVAETTQATALQSTLERDTNRLLRVFGTRSLLTGGGARAPVAIR
jgi:tRNA A37 threonylcarbamoyltransferase TsaD